MPGKGWQGKVNARLKEIQPYRQAWSLAAVDLLKRQSLSLRLYDYFVIRKGWRWMRRFFPGTSNLSFQTSNEIDLWSKHPVPMSVVDKRKNTKILVNKNRPK